MTSEPLSIWLDVTRLVSRTGRGPFTGIDRVENAYLRELLERDLALFGFARTAAGFVLLDRRGLKELRSRIDGHTAWGARDFAALLSRRLSPARQRAEADLRRLAVATCLRFGLERMLGGFLHRDTWLVNVGHSNLSDGVLGAIASAGGKVAAMLHDTIPLDYPELHRPGMAARFRSRVDAVARHADLILTPSAHSARRVSAHARPTRKAVVIPPGMAFLRPDPDALSRKVQVRRPYFVAAGTIDPRKNQGFLIDLWETLGPSRPDLYLAGSRGWCPSDLARRLANLPDGVHELGGLGDGELAALIAGASGLLHPSFSEGYGFTLLEAAGFGTPVVANDLPVYRETLGDAGVYLPLNDRYHWTKLINSLAATDRGDEQKQSWQTDRPTWDAHINHVLSLL